MRGFMQMVGREGVFEAQAKAAPRHGFPYKLLSLDVIIDVEGQTVAIEMQRKPALGGSALVRKVNGGMFQSIFEMSCGYMIEDNMPAERIARCRRTAPHVAAGVRDRGR